MRSAGEAAGAASSSSPLSCGRRGSLQNLPPLRICRFGSSRLHHSSLATHRSRSGRHRFSPCRPVGHPRQRPWHSRGRAGEGISALLLHRTLPQPRDGRVRPRHDGRLSGDPSAWWGHRAHRPTGRRTAPSGLPAANGGMKSASGFDRSATELAGHVRGRLALRRLFGRVGNTNSTAKAYHPTLYREGTA